VHLQPKIFCSKVWSEEDVMYQYIFVKETLNRTKGRILLEMIDFDNQNKSLKMMNISEQKDCQTLGSSSVSGVKAFAHTVGRARSLSRSSQRFLLFIDIFKMISLIQGNVKEHREV
jgi:hypothetical protein